MHTVEYLLSCVYKDHGRHKRWALIFTELFKHIPVRFWEWRTEILRSFGVSGGHFEDDSWNIAGMFFNNTVYTTIYL